MLSITPLDTDGTQPSGRIIPIEGDVSSKDSLTVAAEQVRQKHGYVNVLLPNAGINGPSLTTLPQDPSLSDVSVHLQSWSAEEFNRTFEVNTTGMFLTVAAFLPLLDEGNRRGGLKQKSQIIATSSIGGFNRRPLVGFAYGGSKAAVIHISKQLSTFLGPHGIRSNVLAPGCKYRTTTAPIRETAKCKIIEGGS
jgi:NAD(P)-dependent dehydrogenase (short-subunit alcohol dehydrogenase family)